jgi:hypothetical protein
MTSRYTAALHPSGLRGGAAVGQKVIQGTLVVSIVVLVPSLVSFLVATSSHAPGTLIASILVIGSLVRYLSIGKVVTMFLAVAVAIVSHMLVAALFEPVQFGRALLSLLILGVTITACSCVGAWIFRLPDQIADRLLIVLRIVMVVIGLAGVAGVQPHNLSLQILGISIGGQDWPKPVFPFTEPSHFALAFAPILIDACVRGPGIRRYAWLLLALALGYFLQNLTLIVAVVIAAAVSLPLGGLVLGGIGLAVAVASIDVAYFSDRLDFSATSTNLSTLIYIQGWELVVDSFHRTSGWGLGFQQLGMGPVNSAAADAIFRLNRFELNLQDGGFTAAKLIGEFGMMGVMLILFYVGLAVKLAMRLRGIAKDPGAAPIRATYSYSVILAFSIDLFVRGIGYFNGSALLFMCALFYYHADLAARRRRLAPAALSSVQQLAPELP